MPPTPIPRLQPVATAALALILPMAAGAHPRPLPFTYTHPTQPAGALEIEQFVDAIPVRVAREGETGTDAVTSVRFDLVTELEYGLTDRLEFGSYFVFRQGPAPGSPSLTFQGVKERLRYRLAEAGEWPIDVALYGEVALFHSEFELEEKLLLSKRFGPVVMATNLWVEQEYYWQEEAWKFVYNPTAGVTFEATPAVHVGLEYWARGRFDDEETEATGTTLGGAPAAASIGLAATGPHHYAGPTLMVQGDAGWGALGVYLRVDDLGRTLPVGDEFGRVWVRAILGFDG